MIYVLVVFCRKWEKDIGKIVAPSISPSWIMSVEQSVETSLSLLLTQAAPPAAPLPAGAVAVFADVVSGKLKSRVRKTG